MASMVLGLGEVANQIPSDITNRTDCHERKDQGAEQAGAFGEVFVKSGCRGWRGGGGRGAATVAMNGSCGLVDL